MLCSCFLKNNKPTEQQLIVASSNNGALTPSKAFGCFLCFVFVLLWEYKAGKSFGFEREHCGNPCISIVLKYTGCFLTTSIQLVMVKLKSTI